MGQGIAQVLAVAGHEVRSYDPETERAVSGVTRVRSSFSGRRQRQADRGRTGRRARAAVRGHRSGRRRSGRGHRHRSRRRGRGRQVGVVPTARCRGTRGRGPGVQHQLAVHRQRLAAAVTPDTPRAGDPHALLQPGAGDAPGGDPSAGPNHDRRRGARAGRWPRPWARPPLPARIARGSSSTGRCSRCWRRRCGSSRKGSRAPPTSMRRPPGPGPPARPAGAGRPIGLDVCLSILEVLAVQASTSIVSGRLTSLRELVAAGHLGRKTGRGFHAYPD